MAKMSRKLLLVLFCLLSLAFGWAHASGAIAPIAPANQVSCSQLTHIDHCNGNADLEQSRCALCFALVTPAILQTADPYSRAKPQPLPEPFFNSRAIQPLAPIPILIAET